MSFLGNLILSKCLPALLYGVEACPLFELEKHSFDFSLTRIFMKLFRTGSVDMVTECQKMFSFLPLKYQVDIRTASFMHIIRKYYLSLIILFVSHAALTLNNIYSRYAWWHPIDSIHSLKDAIISQFCNFFVYIYIYIYIYHYYYCLNCQFVTNKR